MASVAVGAVAMADAAWAQTKTFDVPAQPAATGVAAFARQADVQVLISAADAEGRRINAVRGAYTISEALRLLFEGTGLSAQATGPQTWVVVRATSTASTAAAAQVGDVEPSAVSEVIVTAGRRAQAIENVPMSVTALTSDAIERRGLVSQDEYLRSIPGVSSVDQGPGQNIIVIRGAYGEPFSTGPTVGVYFGDIPLTGLALGSSADIKLIDIDRVEVLRGPQGTLYGSNSLSGTIRYIPTAPSLSQTEGRVSVGYSNTAHYGSDNSLVEGVLNLPLVQDRLAFRLVAYRHQTSGFIQNIAGDDPVLQSSAAAFGAQNYAGDRSVVGDSRFSGARAALLWQATDWLSLNFSYLYQDTAQDDRPFAQRPYGRFQRSTYDFSSALGRDDALKMKLEVKNLTAEIDTGFGTITSSTSQVEQDYRRDWEIGVFFPVAGRTPFVPQSSDTRAKLFSQEIRFASELPGPLQTIVGLYYEDGEQPTRQDAYFYGNPSTNPIAPGVLGLAYGNFVDRQVEQKAAFGEISYQLLDALKLTAGARRFHYDATFVSNRDKSANPTGRPLIFETTRNSETGTTLKLGAEFAPSEDSLVYVNYSEGFRLGRPLSQDLIRTSCDRDRDGLLDGTSVRSDLNQVSSDSLSSYEAGAKISVWGGRARLSASVYRNDWSDIPVAFRPPNCLLQTTVNGGKARAKGFEVEGLLTPYPGVRLDFGFGYVNSRLSEASSLGAKGDELNYTPVFNGHLGAEYRYTLWGHESWVRADYTYYDKFFTGLGKRGSKFGAYATVDLNAGINVDNVRVTAFARNLADVYAITSDSGFPANGIYPLRPRTLGVQLDYEF